MCGIVGFTGAVPAAPVLLDGLHKLEYRGYDSAGIAAFSNGALAVVKTRGRIDELEKKVAACAPITAHCGIGHTRWATHGEPSDVNSHPHLSGNGTIAVVHNGIIENYAELREMLKKRGYTFLSETDTEVAAHLIEFLNKGDLMHALREAVSMIRGSYALGVLCAEEPGVIYAARRDNPLVIGLGKGENMIASDIPAIVSRTREYMILNDNETARITPDTVEVCNALGAPVQKEIQTVTWDISAAQKGGYKHFMMKEIMEEPKAVRDTVLPRLKDGVPSLCENGIDETFFRGIGRVQIVACGSALHAGIVGREVIERLAHLPAQAEVASEFRYRDPIVRSDDLCIVISQSGETADTLAALREAKRKGARTLAVVNVVSSSVAREADGVLYTWAGPEISVATTKAYEAQLAALFLIAVRLGIETGTLSHEQAAQYAQALKDLPELIAQAHHTEQEMQYLATKFYNRHSVFFIGRGLDYAAAQEASLKLKEISYIHSEAYAAGELKHGTISLIEQGTLVVALATDDHVFEKMVSNIKSVKARGASVIVVTDRQCDDCMDFCDYLVRIPQGVKEFSPALTVVPMQLFAYYIAVLRGCDVDKPRNLAKSVTVE